jgi:hypothetical protein
MSVKTNLLLALILWLVATPSFSQNRTGFQAPKKDKAALQNTKKTMLGMTLEMNRKSGAAWQDIRSAAPFPLPLFRGNQTKFFKPNAAAGAFLENSHSHNISLITRDPAASVYQFYARALPSAGFVIDNKFPSQVGRARIMVLKGDSPKSCASVTVAPKDDATGPASQVSITVFDKPAPPAAKK